MGRNLDHRVELIVPVEDPDAQAEINDTLDRCFEDDSFAWDLGSDGGWTRRTGGTRSVHRELMERAIERSRPHETGSD
jgi:polyphosphate kinase